MNKRSNNSTSTSALKRKKSIDEEKNRNAKKGPCNNKSDKYCFRCHSLGDEVKCKSCPRVFHSRCLNHFYYLDNGICKECRDIQRTIYTSKHPPVHTVLYSIISEFCPMESKNYEKIAKWPVDKQGRSFCIRDLKYIYDRCTQPFTLYESPLELLSDLKWILHNCIIYYGDKSDVAKATKKLLAKVTEEVHAAFACVKCFEGRDNSMLFLDICKVPHSIIWAKLKGYPFWPAKCLKVENNKAHVRFFKTHQRGLVPVNNCLFMSEEIPKSKKKINLLEHAELIAYIERFKNRFGEFPYQPVNTPFDYEKGEKMIAALLKKESRLKWNRARASQNQEDIPVFDVEDEDSCELIDLTAGDVDAENVTTTSTNSLAEGDAGTSTSDGEGGAGTITSENSLGIQVTKSPPASSISLLPSNSVNLDHGAYRNRIMSNDSSNNKIPISSDVSGQDRKSSGSSQSGSSQSVPGSSRAVPGSSRSVPGSSRSVPGSSRSVPGSSRSVPGSSRSVPGSSRSVPGSSRSVPGSPRSVPGSFQSVPRSFQSVPRSFQSVPGSFQSAPGSSQSAPGSSQSVPGSSLSVPGSSQSVPMKDDDTEFLEELKKNKQKMFDFNPVLTEELKSDSTLVQQLCVNFSASGSNLMSPAQIIHKNNVDGRKLNSELDTLKSEFSTTVELHTKQIEKLKEEMAKQGETDKDSLKSADQIVKGLRGKLAQKYEKCKVLSNKLSKLEEDLKAKNSWLKKLEERIKELEEEKNVFEVTNEKNKFLGQRLSKLEEDLEAKDICVKKLEKKIKEFQNINEQKNVLSLNILELEEDLKIKNSCLKAWEERERHWEGSIKELEEERKKCEDTNEKNKVLGKKLSKLEEDLKAKDSCEKTLLKRKEELEKKINEFEDVNEQNIVLSQQILELEEDLKIKNSSLKQWEERERGWVGRIKELEEEKNELEVANEKNKVLSNKLSKLEKDLKARDSSEKAWQKRERDWHEKEKFWQNKDKELEGKKKELEEIHKKNKVLKQKLSKLEEDLRAKDSSEKASQKREKALQEKDKAWQIKEKELEKQIKESEDINKVLSQKILKLEENLKDKDSCEKALKEREAIIENSKNWCSYKDCQKVARFFCCFNGEKVTKYCSTECSDADSSHKITCPKPVSSNLGNFFSFLPSTSQPRRD